jgi:ATP-binding cassette, subfamily B, bacterial
MLTDGRRRMGRPRAAVHLVAIAFKHHPWLSITLLTLAAVDAALPAVLALATGALLHAATSGHSLTRPLLAFGLAVVAPIGECRWRVAEQLGMRVGDVLDQRLIRAVLAPAGLAHLDDVALRDEIGRAATFWNSSLLEGLISVAVVRTGGCLAALVVVHLAGVLPASLVAASWLCAGWWSWRVAGRSLDAQFDKVPELREVEYLTEVALAPGPGKDVRVFGLGPWFVHRQLQLWTAAMAPVWSHRRRALPLSALVVAAVAAANAGAVLALLHGSRGSASVAAGLSALLATAGLGEVPFGHYELEFGLRTVPANTEVAHALTEPRFILGGVRPANGMPQVGIQLEDVSFAYPTADREVLHGVNLELVAGTSTAIVGVNGAGKSTLVKLLCRFYDPTSGSVRVDGIDLRELDAHSWQARVAGLFQDFVRYPLSARDNIGLRSSGAAGGSDDNAEDVIAAARLAGIADELLSLPKGIDTMLSRGFGGGHELSGGQWQRVALARAIYAVRNGAGLLILDEPTAHLDARAESELYDRFLEVTSGVTTVLVSHRFSTVRRADRIAVLDGGRITERGSHDELLALGGTYAHLFNLQAARFWGSSHGL